MLTFRDALIIAGIVIAALWICQKCKPFAMGAVTPAKPMPSGKRPSLCVQR